MRKEPCYFIERQCAGKSPSQSSWIFLDKWKCWYLKKHFFADWRFSESCLERQPGAGVFDCLACQQLYTPRSIHVSPGEGDITIIGIKWAQPGRCYCSLFCIAWRLKMTQRWMLWMKPWDTLSASVCGRQKCFLQTIADIRYWSKDPILS